MQPSNMFGSAQGGVKDRDSKRQQTSISNNTGEEEDPPIQATAAQLASRKIKTIKGRKPAHSRPTPNGTSKQPSFNAPQSLDSQPSTGQQKSLFSFGQTPSFGAAAQSNGTGSMPPSSQPSNLFGNAGSSDFSFSPKFANGAVNNPFSNSAGQTASSAPQPSSGLFSFGNQSTSSTFGFGQGTSSAGESSADERPHKAASKATPQLGQGPQQSNPFNSASSSFESKSGEPTPQSSFNFGTVVSNSIPGSSYPLENPFSTQSSTAPSTKPTPSLFSAAPNNMSNLFGGQSKAAQAKGSLFGDPPQTQSLFGTPAPQSQSTNNLFGSQSVQPQKAQSSLFGSVANQQSSNLFTPQPTKTQPPNPFASTGTENSAPQTNSLFAGNLFNAPKQDQGFSFNSSLKTPTSKGSSLFSVPTESQSSNSNTQSLFGQKVDTPASSAPLFGQINMTPTSNLFGQSQGQETPLFGNLFATPKPNSNEASTPASGVQSYTSPSIFTPASKTTQAAFENGNIENPQTSPVDVSMTSPEASPKKPIGTPTSTPDVNGSKQAEAYTSSPEKASAQSGNGQFSSPVKSTKSSAHPLSQSTSIEDIKSPTSNKSQVLNESPKASSSAAGKRSDISAMSTAELGRVYALQGTPEEISREDFMTDGASPPIDSESNTALAVVGKEQVEVSKRPRGEFVDEIELPVMPSVFSEEEQVEFNKAYQMQVLKDSCAYAIAASPPGTDLTAILEFYNSRVAMIKKHGKIVALKRKADDTERIDVSTPTKRSKATTEVQSAPPKIDFATPTVKPLDSGRNLPNSGGDMKPAEKGSKRKADSQLTKDEADQEPDRDRFFKKSRVRDAGHTPIAPRTRSSMSDKPIASPTKSTTSTTTNVFKNILRKAVDEDLDSPTPSAKATTPSFTKVTTPSTATNQPPPPVTQQGAVGSQGSAKPSNPTSDNSTQSSAAIKPPTFSVSGTDFMSQFGKKAETSAAAEKQKRKAEDYDSDEETEEQWERRYDEEQRAKKQKLSKEAPKGAVFTLDPSPKPAAGLFASSAKESNPAKGTFSNLFGSDSSSPSVTPVPSTSGGTSVFDSPKLRAEVKLPSAGNIFGHLSADNSRDNSKASSPAGGSDNGNDGDHSEDESEGSSEEDDDEDEDQEYEVEEGGGSANSEAESEDEDEDEDEDNSSEEHFREAAQANPPSSQGLFASAKLNLGSSIFDSAKSNETKTSSASKPQGRSLFDRIERDDKGEPLRETQSSSSLAQDSAKPSESSVSNNSIFAKVPASGASPNLFGSLAPASSSNNLFSFAPASQPPTSGLFGSPSSNGGSHTWNPNTPIKFGTASAPDINITAASPVKATSESKDTSTPKLNLFGSTSSPALGFAFGGPPKSAVPSSLFLSAGSTSGVSSRGSSPGATTDTGAESANDSAIDSAKDETAGGEVSEDKSAISPAAENEQVLFKSKAKAHVYDKEEKKWVTRGLGMIYVLKIDTEKNDGKTRMVFKVRPGGGIALNTHVLVNGKYTANSSKGVNFVVPLQDGFEQWLLSFGNPELAKEIANTLQSVKH